MDFAQIEEFLGVISKGLFSIIGAIFVASVWLVLMEVIILGSVKLNRFLLIKIKEAINKNGKQILQETESMKKYFLDYGVDKSKSLDPPDKDKVVNTKDY